VRLVVNVSGEPTVGELWTCGRAAREIGHGVTPRMVARWVDSRRLDGVQAAPGCWRLVVPASALALRDELLAQLKVGRHAAPVE
jgi:hypothetical protein